MTCLISALCPRYPASCFGLGLQAKVDSLGYVTIEEGKGVTAAGVR